MFQPFSERHVAIGRQTNRRGLADLIEGDLDDPPVIKTDIGDEAERTAILQVLYDSSRGNSDVHPCGLIDFDCSLGVALSHTACSVDVVNGFDAELPLELKPYFILDAVVEPGTPDPVRDIDQPVDDAGDGAHGALPRAVSRCDVRAQFLAFRWGMEQ